jgi:hypothetical protein
MRQVGAAVPAVAVIWSNDRRRAKAMAGAHGHARDDGDARGDGTAARWEWRVFGESLALPAAPRLQMRATDAEETEIYLLSTRSIQNVKVRRDAIDIKLLDAVEAGGLERWRPAGHFSFPLGPAHIARIEEALGMVISLRLGYPLDRERFIAALTSLDPALKAVTVTKRRTRFLLAACAGEQVELTINGRRMMSLALEDSSPGFVATSIRMIGLQDAVNLNYPRFLKSLLGIRDRHETTPSPEPLELTRTNAA